MNLLEMFEDYCRRSPRPITLDQLLEIAKRNHILIDDGCFIIYAVALGEVRILMPYAPRGKSIIPIGRNLEQIAKDAGMKKISIITHREKPFARMLKDYSPVATVFEKKL